MCEPVNVLFYLDFEFVPPVSLCESYKGNYKQEESLELLNYGLRDPLSSPLLFVYRGEKRGTVNFISPPRVTELVRESCQKQSTPTFPTLLHSVFALTEAQ